MVECQKEVLELRDEVKQAMGRGFEAGVEKKLNPIKFMSQIILKNSTDMHKGFEAKGKK